ncbi:retrovirus-related pol polyprotein from transposon TNT 1-94 [Tanacetum coccineum]
MTHGLYELAIITGHAWVAPAWRVIDDLIEFSGETSVDGYMSFFKSQQITESHGFINRMRQEANTAKNLVGQLNSLIAEMEALEDQGELFDTLMDLRDDKEAAKTKLQGDIYDARFNNKASLAEMINKDKWKWHNERKDVFPELISIPVPSCSIHKDKAVWRCNNGSLKDYSTKQNIPSHAFVLSMAIQKRFMTQDIIYQWNKDNSMKCSLCSSCMDSHDHLFFNALSLLMALFNKKAIKDIVRRLVVGALLKLMSLSVPNSANVQRVAIDWGIQFKTKSGKIKTKAFKTIAELSSLYIGVLLFKRYASILNILQGRNELLEKIIRCVVDSGGVPELHPKVSNIWGVFGIA